MTSLICLSQDSKAIHTVPRFQGYEADSVVSNWSEALTTRSSPIVPVMTTPRFSLTQLPRKRVPVSGRNTPLQLPYFGRL